MFFQGNRIYSYGMHYCIAQIHGRAVLINSNGYSNSTAKHTGHVRRAFTHRTTFSVPNVSNPQSPDNLTHLSNNVADAVYSLIVCNKVSREAWELERIAELIGTFNAYCVEFDIADRIDLDAETLADLKALHAAKLARTIELDNGKAARDAIKAAKAEVEFKESVKAWKSFQGNLKGYSNEVFLRVNADRQLVETSRGASVPLDAANELVNDILSGKPVAGKRIGSFEVTRLTDTHVIIGCHNIPLVEMKRVFSIGGDHA
tara:strand:- start:844 stop:1623 length:780 start_codon:yes stop_codon:yes gene_type:complete